MKKAVEALEKVLESTSNDQERAEIRRAIDTLKRIEQSTDPETRPDYRDPNFKQVANEPTQDELKADREKREYPQTVREPSKESKTPPPIET